MTIYDNNMLLGSSYGSRMVFNYCKLENREKNCIAWDYIIQCNTKNEKVTSLVKVL